MDVFNQGFSNGHKSPSPSSSEQDGKATYSQTHWGCNSVLSEQNHALELLSQCGWKLYCISREIQTKGQFQESHYSGSLMQCDRLSEIQSVVIIYCITKILPGSRWFYCKWTISGYPQVAHHTASINICSSLIFTASFYN